jgi:hypothetical protein
MSTRVRIQNVRFNYTNSLFTAQVPQQGEGKAKFSVVAIIPRDHPQLAEIKAAMAETAKAKWGEAFVEVANPDSTKSKLPSYQVVLKSLAAGDRLCLHDGDAKSDKAGYAGNLFINASNELRPLVVGPAQEVLTAADGKPYSGSYGNVIVEFWAQDNKFGKRVNASLMGAQHVKDGDRLSGGGIAAADDFEAIPQPDAAKAATAGTGAAALF